MSALPENDSPRDSYETFLDSRAQIDSQGGFAPTFIPDSLFDFQRALATWALRKGRAAVFADCGTGKTILELTVAENIVRHTNKPVLILNPLAVSAQTIREGNKFGIECKRTNDGTVHEGINVTNYERLHYFNPNDFAGVICDESSILKNFSGVRRAAITEFMRTIPYRLLCTATAAPNDFVELGTSSEALGQLGHMDMLAKFFKNDQNSNHPNRLWAGGGKWRFRGHAEHDFWRWICSWARALRKPSDLGFDDGAFILPELITREHVVEGRIRRTGMLFDPPANTLSEQREERRLTLNERCERVAELVDAADGPSVAWCHLNDEGELLAEIIPDSVQISGSDSDDKKEEVFLAFADGQIPCLVTKSVLAGFGQNWQACAHQAFFASNSWEQWYQSIRRSWRFGQKRPVTIDLVTSRGEAGVLANLRRKAEAADIMFARLVAAMNAELFIRRSNPFTTEEALPPWLS